MAQRSAVRVQPPSVWDYHHLWHSKVEEFAGGGTARFRNHQHSLHLEVSNGELSNATKH
ncbi:MAG: hypothetical protein U0175_32885 [Caldilineaceae bacterium]